MTTLSGCTEYESGDTKPVAPSSNQNLAIYTRSSAFPATVANTTAYMEDSTGAEAPLINGVASGNLSSVSVTLVAGTFNVVFGTSIAGANYRIGLSTNADETVHWSSKASTGFTITSSDGTSTSTVDVIITQQGAP